MFHTQNYKKKFEKSKNLTNFVYVFKRKIIEIYKYALSENYGNKYDDVIDIFEFRQENFNDKLFYHDIYLLIIIDIKNDQIEINTNILRTRYYQKITGNKFTGHETSEIRNLFNLNFGKNLKLKYNRFT